MTVFSVAVLTFTVLSRPFSKHLLRVDILTPCLVLPKEAGLRIFVLTIYRSEKTCRMDLIFSIVTHTNYCQVD